MVPVDNVVELSEVFLMRISAASAHIKITGVTTYQFIVDSGDGKTNVIEIIITMLISDIILLPLIIKK